MSMEFSIGGFNVKGWMLAVALPVLSTISGGIYFGYDTLNRFFDTEAGVEQALDESSANAQQIIEIQKSLTKLSNDSEKERTANKTFAANQLMTASQAIRKELQEAESTITSRIQTVEQAVVDNDVRGLNTKLAQLTTNMQQILEQQKILLDLRSQVDKATTITNGIGEKLDVIQTEIDDIWKAYDSLVENPL